jgi:hypothetical protein
MKENHKFAEIANRLTGAELYTANDSDYSVRDENNEVVARYYPNEETMVVVSNRPHLSEALKLTFKN